MPYTIIGKNVTKVDAREKATGEAIYTGDIHLPGTLYGLLLRSPVAHARIVKIDTRAAEELSGVSAVLTGKDTAHVRIGRFLRDRTPLASGKVRYIGEPVAAVAAVDKPTATKALGLIKITYEELPAVFDPEEALQPGAPVIHEELASYFDVAPSKRYGNVRNESRYAWGDLEAAMAEADLVYEGTYCTQAIHPAYLEPRHALAVADAHGKVTIWSSTKSPFTFRGLVAQCLGVSISKVRMIAPTIGGDFGGKGTPTIEPICGMLAQKTGGRPVRLESTREEELAYGFVRHPARIRLKTAMRKDGVLLAVQGELIYDTGAYNDAIMGLTFSSANLVGPYKCKAAEVVGRTVYTNNLPAGHVRAPGAPQTLFAIESQMDIMARKLRLDPWEVRRINAVEDGSTTGMGHGTIRNSGLKACLRKAHEVAFRSLTKDGPYQGIGMACSQWEVFPFEFTTPSRALVMVNEDGSVTLHSGITEQGGGQYTTMAQIVAEEMGLSIDDIGLVVADTDATPYEGGTGASATTQRAGNSVRFAAQDAREQLLALASERLEAGTSDLVLENKRVYVKGAPHKGVPVAELLRSAIGLTGGPIIGSSVEGQKALLAAKKEAHGIVDAPSYGAQAVKVQVDPETGDVRILSYIAAQDSGFAINPKNVEGQVEGGIVFGIGYALTEEIRQDGGKGLNSTLVDYRLPTATDLPDINVTLVEQPSTFGPYGAKGVGESGTTPVAAALANAIEDAIGVRITDLPITPQKVLRALKEKVL
ncbi:MAG: xanthine dehydrogenase family protein molybdopterin-binding subunit [Dehalococcoidia bacterium]|nr:xanthine dehydrogenase family protein molybdopterin-binding subunit [Dehalococcoidia bacterium]